MNERMGIQDLLRAGDVKRWTIVRTAKQQSIAEHTFNVVMIARAIAKEYQMDDIYVIKYALEHDLDEIRTGDIPSPTKRAMKEEGTHVEYRGKHKPNDHGYPAKVVKAADLIEMCWFISENAIGRHASQVERYMWQNFDEFISTCHPKFRDAVLAVANKIFEEEFMVV